MKNYAFIICFIIFSQKAYTQEIINLNHLSNNIPEKPLFEKSIYNRDEIKFSTEAKTGYWKIFKNWNEGRAVVAENDTIVWVGTNVGIVRWNTQTSSYKTFDENQGLMFTTVNAVTLDQNMNLWIGSTQGLVKYDGINFVHYDYTNSPLPNAKIECLAVDKLNRIVLAYGPSYENGTYQYGGVARFDGKNWKKWSYNASSYWGDIVSIVNYKDTVWIGGGGNLFILTDNTFETAPNWNYGAAYSIAIDSEDSIWVSTNSRKTFKLNKNGWTIAIDQDTEAIGFNMIWGDPEGGIWLSQREIWWLGDRPLRLNLQKRRQGVICGTNSRGICTVPGIPGQFYSHFAISPSAQFFVSIGIGSTYPSYVTEQGGLFKYNGSQWTVYRVPTTILQNKIYGLGKGKNGNIYLSTPYYSQKTDGVNWETIGGWVTGVRNWNKDFKLAPNNQLYTHFNQIYPNKDSYSGYVTGLDFDGFGNLWTAYPMIRFKWPNMALTSYYGTIKNLAAPYDPQIMDIIVDKDENIWAAAWYYGGIKFNRTSFELYPPSDTTLPNGDYDEIFADSRGRIWFCTNQWSPNYGFTVYDGKNWNTYYSPERYGISYVYQVAEDNQRNVWLATGGGLIKYDGVDFIVYDHDNSPLSSHITNAVTADDRGNIWVGTDNGLYVFNPNSEIELGEYSFTSPINNLSVSKEENRVRISFQPNNLIQNKITYQLERGRGLHKFWKIYDETFENEVPANIEMFDSSNFIGKYYYRINEISSDGKQRYSEAVEIQGKTPGVSISRFNKTFSGNKLLFSWWANNEVFVKRYELWKSDTTYFPFRLIKIIPVSASADTIKQYEIEGDVLGIKKSDIRYNLRVVFADSTYRKLDTLYITGSQSALPTSFRISNNYPNPFNGSTTLDLSLPCQGWITMKIFNALGEEVYSYEKFMEQGYYSLQLNFENLPSGVYFYSVKDFDKILTGKMVLLK